MSDSTTTPKSEKVAILVIHGIGQQKPYETLDNFTRNLMGSLAYAGQPWSITPQLDQVPDPDRDSKNWVRASYVIAPPSGGATFASGPAPKPPIADISLFEYYWAPITQDKITYTGSLLFLIKAGLQPFLYLAANISAISRAAKNQEKANSMFRVIAREIWRQACLFVPLLILFVALLSWLKSATFASLKGLTNIDWPLVVILGLLAIRYLYLYSSARGLWKSAQAEHGWQTSWKWRAFLAAGVVLHLFAWPFALAWVLKLFLVVCIKLGHCCPFLVSVHTRHWKDLLNVLIGRVTFPCGQGLGHQIAAFFYFDPSLARYTPKVITVLLAAFVRYILVDYVGDVAVYVDTNEFSKSYAVRSQIIDECTVCLSGILTKTEDGTANGKPMYDRVLIAAHSLGSVIAYDTMNNLLDLARSSATPGTVQADDLLRLRGLATFGCPLNKIFYFFREQDSPKPVLRDQTLDLLYSFRTTVPTEVQTASFAFQTVSAWKAAEDALETGFRWINAYSLEDPISGWIIFYRVDCQKRFEYPWPFLAHTSYWSDSRFYGFFRENLL